MLVSASIDSNLIYPAKIERSGKFGDSLHSIGIDIGGTKIAAGLVDSQGVLSNWQRVNSPAQDPEAMADAVVELIQGLQSQGEVSSVGVAAAGFIDAERSTILYSPNLNWRHEPLRERIQSRINLPVVIENDANAAAWAEFQFGAAKDVKSMVMLTIGTGVGGAIVDDGRLIRGGFGIGGELGHFRLIPDGRVCGCGQRGCVEQYASGTALLKSARKLASSEGPAGSRLRELQGDNPELTGAEVAAAINEGDPSTLALLRELGDYLGQALGTIAAILDPQVCVIGGGVSDSGDLLLDPIREAYLKALPARGFRPELEVRLAHHTNQAGVIGVADLARHRISGDQL